MPGTQDFKGAVDVAILAVEAGDLEALGERLPEWAGILRAPGARAYDMFRAGDTLVAMVRGAARARSDMARAAATAIEELAPAWLLVVGVATGLPADDPWLGDVVVATSVLDHGAEAVMGDGARAFAPTPTAPEAAALVASLGTLDLGPWTADLDAPPDVDLSLRSLYGTKRTKAELHALLRRRAGAALRPPRVVTGAVLASDAPLAEIELTRIAAQIPHRFRAIETEAASVHRVAHERGVPVLVARGIADLVGARRSPAWEAYARKATVAFAAALVRSGALRRPTTPTPSAPRADRGDPLGQAAHLSRLGDAALERGDVDAAAARYAEATPLFRAIGDVRGEAGSALRSGEIALRRGDIDEARCRYLEALPLFRRVQDALGEANCVARLGDLALRRGDADEARRRTQEAQPLYRRAGDVQGEANCALRLGDLALRRGDADEAHARLEEALGLYARVNEPYSMGLAHRKLARLAEDDRLRRRHLEAARDLWARAGRAELVAKLDAELAGK